MLAACCVYVYVCFKNLFVMPVCIYVEGHINHEVQGAEGCLGIVNSKNEKKN